MSADVTDIVERLRGWREVPGLSCPPFLEEAADEIERLNGRIVTGMAQLRDLRADNERLRALVKEVASEGEAMATIDSLNAEIERLRAEIELVSK